ncbi:MAG: hypothetical protein IPL49_11250 [Saprospirales bacterium]|nr:hypothetical protein [Saprospirales bacterium]
MTLQSIKDHILSQIGTATIGTLPLDEANFLVAGTDDLVTSMKSPATQMEIKGTDVVLATDEDGIEFLQIPVQNATVEFTPPGVSAGLTLHSHDFEIHIYEENGGNHLKWTGAFDQFELTQFYNLGWIPDSIELPQLEFAALLLQGSTANGSPATFSLGARLKESYEIIPDLDARLSDATVLYTGYVDPAKSSELTLSGMFSVGDSGSRVAVSLPTVVEGPWTFQLAAPEPGEPIEPFSLADLFQLVGGVNIFQELPAELNIADNFTLSELTITYEYASTGSSLNYLKVALGLGNWNLFYGLTIKDARLAIEITDPFEPNRVIQTTIGGGYEIRNSSNQIVATLDVELFIPTDGSDWEMTASGGFGSDSEGFLGAISGDLDINEWLPDSLSDPTLVINEFYLRFSPGRRKIFQTRINVGLDLEWVIVDNLLSLADPYFAFDIIWPDNPEADAVRVLDLYSKTEKAQLVSSLGDLSTQLNDLSAELTQANNLIASANPGELANLEAEYQSIFLQKTDGIQQRFVVDVKNKLSEIEKLEQVQAVIDDPNKAVLDGVLNKLGLGPNPVKPSPVKTLETALEDCKKSLRGSLFSNAATHATTAKKSADDMIIAIGTETMQALLDHLKTQSASKPENQTKINAQLGGYVGLPGNTRMHVLASRDETKTWRFLGKLEGDLALIDTAKKFLGNGINPPTEFNTNLKINVLEAEIIVPPASGKKTFRILCGMEDLWSFKLGDFSLSAESLLFAIEYKGAGQTTGVLSGTAVFNGMKVILSYAFAPNQTKITLNWEGIIGAYTSSSTSATISLTIADKSVGDIISLLVKTVNPGLGTYRLPEPWDFMDKIPADFNLTYTLRGAEKGKLTASKPLNIDILGLVTVESVDITRTHTGQMNVGLKISGLENPNNLGCRRSGQLSARCRWSGQTPHRPPPPGHGAARSAAECRADDQYEGSHHGLARIYPTGQ